MSATPHSTFQFFWQDRSIISRFRSGVSLHSHTMYSEESLEMIPCYTRRIPWLRTALGPQLRTFADGRRCTFDVSKGFWTPPYSPRQAYRLEEKQIQRRLQLPALVSLSDHDDIRAGSQIRIMDRFRKAPISNEWTVPFGRTFFHLGLHNLPVDQSAALTAELASYTACPKPERLGEILLRLNSHPELLIVANHPLWDEKGIGIVPHRAELMRLLQQHGRHVHALELNGLRSWHENQQVIALARELNLPALSGGDRHGREPNAILNLSMADSFPAFVEEVRYRRTSHVLFMPQYREHTNLRLFQMVVEVLCDFPENAEGRRLWSDRIFCRDRDTGLSFSLTSAWRDAVPPSVQLLVRAMRLTQLRGVRSALRLALENRSADYSILPAILHDHIRNDVAVRSIAGSVVL